MNPFSYRINTTYLDMGYSKDSGYFYFGINVNTFDMSFPAASTPFRTSGGGGAQFGGGFMFDQNWSVEAVTSGAVVRIESGTNYATKDELVFTDLSVSLRYGF